jgi:hypothetical protein
MSHDSSLVIATGYGLDDRMVGVRFPTGSGNFFLLHRVQTGSGTHPASFQWVPWALSLGREADHSSPSSAEINEYVELYFHSPIPLHGVVLS